MRLLVTGAGGMLGHKVVAHARLAGHDVVAADRATLDVTDEGAVYDALRDSAPDAVINCAAFTDVDGAEEREERALAVNGRGAGNVARAAAQAGARMVHVSTDYVFDGAKDTPWLESDPTGPLGAYGRTKLAGEREVAAAGAAGPHYAIVRTAWLFGVGGQNFVDTMLRLASERDEVSVVTDQIGCPTWTGHLAPALVALAQRPDEVGVFHGAAAGHCSWNELAAETFRQSGLPCRVSPTTSEAFKRPAPRPAWSVLGSERSPGVRLPPWRDGLRGHLDERNLE